MDIPVDVIGHFCNHMNYLENDVFYMDEKVRILTSKYDPDFYVMVMKDGSPRIMRFNSV